MIHPLVDARSVSVLVVGGMTWERVIAYNALAFALQLFCLSFLMNVASYLTGACSELAGEIPSTQQRRFVIYFLTWKGFREVPL